MLTYLGFWDIDVLVTTKLGRPICYLYDIDNDAHIKTRLSQYESLSNGKNYEIAKRILIARAAGKYADICFIPPFNQAPDFYERDKAAVLKAAKEEARRDKIEFIAGDMGWQEPFSMKKSSERIEAARKNEASYFLISFVKQKIALL